MTIQRMFAKRKIILSWPYIQIKPNSEKPKFFYRKFLSSDEEKFILKQNLKLPITRILMKFQVLHLYVEAYSGHCQTSIVAHDYTCLILFQKEVPISQKQPSKGVLKKRCYENMQQICRRTPMPKCDFNKVAYFPAFGLNLYLSVFSSNEGK